MSSTIQDAAQESLQDKNSHPLTEDTFSVAQGAPVEAQSDTKDAGDPLVVLLIDDSDGWDTPQKDLLALVDAFCDESRRTSSGLYDVHILCRKESHLHRHLISSASEHAPYTCETLFSQSPLSTLAVWRIALRLLWRFRKKPHMCVHTFSPSCLPLVRRFMLWRHRDKKHASHKGTLFFHSAFATPEQENVHPRDVVRTAELAEKILCPSQHLLHTWAEAGAQPEKLSVVHPICHGAKGEISHTQNTEEMPERFIFMAFEKLEDDAGLGVLLKAMSALWQHPHLPEWEVRIVGKGSRFDALLREAEALGVAPRLGIFGEQPVEYMVSTAHAIVCPYTQPAGNMQTLMIAWCYGLPLVCTQVEANMELATKHNALLVSPNDPQGLAAAMISCMCDKDVRKRTLHMSATMTHYACLPRLQDEYMTIYEDSVVRHDEPFAPQVAQNDHKLSTDRRKS